MVGQCANRLDRRESDPSHDPPTTASDRVMDLAPSVLLIMTRVHAFPCGRVYFDARAIGASLYGLFASGHLSGHGSICYIIGKDGAMDLMLRNEKKLRSRNLDRLRAWYISQSMKSWPVRCYL